MLDLLSQAMKIKTDGVFMVVLGASGAGKSHLIGTYPGKTLILYGAGESHGPSSAALSNKDLIAVSWDKAINEKGELEQVPPAKLLARIKALLDPELLKPAGVKCVALDSITNLCLDIKKTPAFAQRCTSSRGQHNAFKETEALVELLSLVISQLQTLHDEHGIDVIATMDLQIQTVSLEGLILESKPGLPSFGVGKAVIQQFPDIVVLGRLGEKRTPTLQNFAKSASVSRDLDTKEMVKYVEYNPRLRGVEDLPETLEASLPAILALKNKKRAV